MYVFVLYLYKTVIVIPTGEGKDRPSLNPIPVTYVYNPTAMILACRCGNSFANGLGIHADNGLTLLADLV